LKLLIHHHTIAFEKEGQIWVQSFIGQWVEHLSIYFEEVDLLLFKSKTELPQLDFCLSKKNIKLMSLGNARKGQWIQKAIEIPLVCRKISKNYDLLLIRGITPRQMLVYKSCKTSKKAFLLVGSIRDNKPKFVFNIPGLVDWILHKKRLWELRTISKNSLMLANSPGLVKELAYFYNVKAKFVPTNTIKQEDFSQMICKTYDQPLKLLFCGRVVKDKGIEDLINAINLLNERDIECKLDIVGNLDSNYKVLLDCLAEEIRVKHQIRYSGFVPFGSQLLQHYKDASIYILPSWHEGFPHAIWEAAASYTNIITTSVGGIPEIISEKEVYFIQPHSPGAIAEAVTCIIQSQDIAREKVRNAYILAHQYTSEKCAARMFEALNGNLNE